MPKILTVTVPYDKLVGLACNLCGRPDVAVASVGYEWGYEFCATCLRAMADDLDDPSVETIRYADDD